MKNVLVLGGTGFVGRQLCEQLQRQGWRMTVPTRRLLHAAPIQHLPHVTVLKANIHNPAELAQLVAGHDAVVNLVAILNGSEADFERVHVQLPTQLARACAASGLRRVVHVSALGASPQAPSHYLRSKARGEQALRQSDLKLTVLRPSVIFGAGDHFLNTFAQLQTCLPIIPLASARSRFQPVWVQDVASAILAALDDDGLPHYIAAPSTAGNDAHLSSVLHRTCNTIGETFECVGPQVFTLSQLVHLAGRYGSTKRPVIPLPAFAGYLQAWFMEKLPGQPLLTRDSLASLSVDNIASGQHPDLLALGIEPAHILAIAPSYLGHRGPRSALLKVRMEH